MSVRKFRIIKAIIVTGLMVSCQSHEQKPDEAFEAVKQDKLTEAATAIKDTGKPAKPTHIATIISNTASIITKANKALVQDEWFLFQLETEKKIELNKASIREMRELPNAGDKLIKKNTRLEQDNNALRRQMDEYREDVKVRWENFKLTLTHDVNQIQIELKDLAIKNSK